MLMMKMMQSFGDHDEDHHSTRHNCFGRHGDSHDRMDSMDMDHMDMDMFSKMFKSMKSNNYDSYKKDDFSPMMKRFMGGFQKRQADDSLELNDRLKEKLENLMQEHVSELSNMTCILREMNVLDTRNKIDIAAM